MSDLVGRLNEDWEGAVDTARRYVGLTSDACGGKINKTMHEMPAKHGNMWAHALAAEDGALDRIATLERELAEARARADEDAIILGKEIEAMRDDCNAADAERDQARAECAALVEALQDARVELEACWLNHYGENPEGSPIPPHIQKAAEAVVNYGQRGKALMARLNGLLENAPRSIHQLVAPAFADPLGLVCYFDSEAKMDAWLAALTPEPKEASDGQA